MEKAEILVLGAGPAGLYAAEAASKHAAVVLAGSEKYLPYYRPRLSKILSGLIKPEEIAIKPEEWFLKNRIALFLGRTAVKVDARQKTVIWQDGNSTQYDKLVLAAGSHSFLPSIPDVETVYALRSYDDAVLIHKAAQKAGRAVVYGGGLLGLETAYYLGEAGVAVTVIERNAWLLHRQLPKEGGEFLASFLARHNIQLLLNADTGAGQPVTKDACVIAAAGVRSNIEFLKNSGLELDKAVLVDEKMRTNDPDVFACGDIAQFKGKAPGLFPVAMEQGKIAGANAAGGEASYAELIPSPMLKIGDLSVFSTGDNQSGTVYVESGKEAFASISIKEGILIGGALIGDISKANKLKNAVSQRKQAGNVKSARELLDNLN